MESMTLEYIQNMQKSPEFITDMETYNKEFPYEPSELAENNGTGKDAA